MISDRLSALAAVDFVIEAAPEQRALKERLIAELDALLPGAAILAANTSSISITALAAATRRPKRVRRALHEPGPGQMLVEIVRGLQTSERT